MFVSGGIRQPVDTINRVPSLAAGIGGAGFEWNPSPVRPPSAASSDLSADSNLTFASAAPDDGASSSPKQSMFASQSQAGTSADMSTYGEYKHEGSDEVAGNPVAKQDSSMFDDTTHEQDAGAGSSLPAIQTNVPGLAPLRLTPKTDLAQPRSAPLQFHLTLPHSTHVKSRN